MTSAPEVATVARLEDGASSKHPRHALKSFDGGHGGGRPRARHAVGQSAPLRGDSGDSELSEDILLGSNPPSSHARHQDDVSRAEP